MTPIAAAISSIINGKSYVCCLCLNTIQEEPIHISDDVVINLFNETCDKAVKDVLTSVFDEKMINYINTFNTICEQCIKQTVSYYKFIQTSHHNAEYLQNVLSTLTNSIEYTTDVNNGSKSLFVSLNLQDYTSKHYYDIKQTPTTAKAALKRFQGLDQIENLKFEMLMKKIKNENERKKKRCFINISTSDMFDKSNSQIVKCKVCHKEFLSVPNLRNHYIRSHAPKVFKCTECPRSYGAAAFLEVHRNESHCTVVCSECGKTFYNRHTLKIHEASHNMSIVCQDCGRVYKTQSTFKAHKDQNVCGKPTRANPSDAKFTCDYCNKKYTQKMSLRVHIQHEHGNYKTHICEWCGKKFWAQSRLKAHIVKHTKEKNFACKICNGKFVSKTSLLYHTRIHTGEKPYKCPHCDYRFLSISRRSEHVKHHHLGGMLECDICHSKFTTRLFLQKHKKTHMKINDMSNVSSNSNLRSSYASETKMVPNKLNTNPEVTKKDIWKMGDFDEIGIQAFQNVIESGEVQIQNFVQDDYENEIQQHCENNKLYLEVTDDADEFKLYV